jgi:hypothetical protein
MLLPVRSWRRAHSTVEVRVGVSSGPERRGDPARVAHHGGGRRDRGDVFAPASTARDWGSRQRVKACPGRPSLAGMMEFVDRGTWIELRGSLLVGRGTWIVVRDSLLVVSVSF